MYVFLLLLIYLLFLHQWFVPILKIAFPFMPNDWSISVSKLKKLYRMFGKAVVNMREQVRINRTELAKRSGVSLHLLGRIENGTIRPDRVGLKEICKIADGIKARPRELMNEYEKLLKKAGEAWW
jgi:transcriptional regulator with XRE-family HTH domain